MWIVAPGWFDDLVAPGRELRRSANGVLSALSSHEGGSRYDGRAALYDRLVSNSFYNRRVWRSSVASYATFAAAAVASGDGPMLDVGCGTAVFTADAYRVAERPLVLVDRSLGMLTRAAQRLELRSQDPSRIVLVQATSSICRFDRPPSRQWPVSACCTCSRTSSRCWTACRHSSRLADPSTPHRWSRRQPSARAS